MSMVQEGKRRKLPVANRESQQQPPEETKEFPTVN